MSETTAQEQQEQQPEHPSEAAATGEQAEYAPEEIAAAEAPAMDPADVNLDLVLNVPVNVALRVGSTDISIGDLVKLMEGSVIELDRPATEPMDVLVNGTLIAHGEIVIVNDNFGVRLTDVVSPAERIRNIN